MKPWGGLVLVDALPPVWYWLERDNALLEGLRRQPYQCRELIRKRVYGLVKLQATSGAVPDTGSLVHQGLDHHQYDLLRQFGAEALRGNTALLQQAWLLDYVEVPPSIMEFIRDDRFLGQTYQHEEGADELYPVWEETLHRDFDLDCEIHNLVLTGALGIGKTTVLVLIILYRLCLATMLRNPQRFFGVGRVSRLVFVLLSVTKPTARETAFHEALNRMRLSSYFLFWLRDECGFRFGKITADQYQADMLLQTLQMQGLAIGNLSVDRDKTVYEAWRNGIEGHQIRLYAQGILLKEAEFLQELDRKFDHPVGGSKDLTDAAAGAYFNAIHSEEKTTLSIQNVPAVYGIGPTPVGHDAALMDFGIIEEYMRRNPRRRKAFDA